MPIIIFSNNTSLISGDKSRHSYYLPQYISCKVSVNKLQVGATVRCTLPGNLNTLTVFVSAINRPRQ